MRCWRAATRCGSWTTWRRASASACRTPPTFAELDIRDGAALGSLAGEVRPQVVFHLAAQADVRVSVENPGLDADVNVLGTIAVLNAARSCDARVVFSSTGGALYGEADTVPSDEATPIAPMAPYGTSKFCGEQYLELFNRLHGTRNVTLRYGNVYGPRQDPHGEAGVVAIFFGKLVAGETPLIFGDGLQTRDYVHVGDVVAANLRGRRLRGPAGRLQHRHRASRPTWSTCSPSCQSAAGTAIEPEHRPARLGELSRSALDCSRAHGELGWRPAVELDDGLRETLAALHP